jgi:hypothetical protein
MLRDIRELLTERGPMELRDLAIHFETDASAMTGMMEFLESRGQVKRMEVDCGSGGCGGCTGCGSKKEERTTSPSESSAITFWTIEHASSK